MTVPVVSIVTPTYNGARYLGALIESVQRQSYPSIEHIVIDDGSRDEGATVELMKKYPSVRFWSRPNKGQYPTINEGLEAATGEFFTTISADDYYFDANAIAALVESVGDADGSFGVTLWVDEGGEPLPVQPPQRLPWAVFPYYPFVSHCSMIVRRERLVRDEMFFNPTYRFVGDYDWMLRMGAAGYRFERTPSTIACYRQNPGQTTSLKNYEAMQRETRPLRERYATNRVASVAIHQAVVWRHRALMAESALRIGGPSMLLSKTLSWLRGRR